MILKKLVKKVNTTLSDLETNLNPAVNPLAPGYHAQLSLQAACDEQTSIPPGVTTLQVSTL